jgi:hypothetical protein
VDDGDAGSASLQESTQILSAIIAPETIDAGKEFTDPARPALPKTSSECVGWLFGNDTESKAACSATAKTDSRQIFSCPCKYRVFKDRRVVTDRGEKYEGMPDRVLKTQAPPDVKDDSGRIQHPTGGQKPDNKTGK